MLGPGCFTQPGREKKQGDSVQDQEKFYFLAFLLWVIAW